MKNRKNKLPKRSILVIAFASVLMFVGFNSFIQQAPWTAPATANQKTNSVTADVTNNLTGKNLYVKESGLVLLRFIIQVLKIQNNNSNSIVTS